MSTTIQIIIGGLLQGSIFAMLAIGFSLVYRVTKIVNLAQGAFCIVGALTMYTLETQFGISTLPAAILAVGATVLLGAILGATTFVPAMRTLPQSSMLMLTTGLLTMLEGLVLLVWGSQPYALPPFGGEAPMDVFGIRVVPQTFWILGSAAVAITLLWFWLTRTVAGKALRACADNPSAARLMGINVPWMTLLSFTVAAGIGALGGILVAPVTSLQFDTGRAFTNAGFMAVAIGGLGSFLGSIGGGFLLGVTSQMASAYISSLFSNALTLSLLLAVLLWRPNGLFSSGYAGRSDAREETRAHRAIIRLTGPRSGLYALIAVGALMALPLVLDESLLNTMVITFILFIAVLGLDILMGFTGQVSLGQAGFMAIGGYTSAILATQYEVSPLMGTLAGIIVSLVCALALSVVTMRLRGVYLALATLAFGLLVDSLVVGLTDLTGGPSGMVGIPSFSVADIVFGTSMSMYYLVLGLSVILVLMLLGVANSGFGRALQAIRTDQMAAEALGINVSRHKMAVFAISAALASLSGSLYAFYFHFLSPEMVGSSRSFELIAILVVGGEGTLVGGLLGTILITMLPTIFQPFALYKTLAQGTLLVLAFRYLPSGIFGTVAARYRLWALAKERAMSAAPSPFAARKDAS